MQHEEWVTKTLAAIAIACLGLQAYAVAPSWNEIPQYVRTRTRRVPR